MSEQYNPPSGPPPHPQQQPEPHYPAYPQQSYPQQNAPSYLQQNTPPNPPPRHTGTDAILPTGQDRTEQMETFQAYEASKPQSDEDKAQETLQREFPSIDSSLIMAIWNDSQDLGQTREMLQELTRADGP